MRNRVKVLLPIVIQTLSLLYVLTVSRVLLMLINYNDVASQHIFAGVIRQGFEYDLLLVGLLLIVPSILLPTLTSTKKLLSIWRLIIPGYSAACITVVVAMETITPAFLKHFNTRPNEYFGDYVIQYLRFGDRLWHGHVFVITILTVIELLMMVGVFLYFRKLLSNVHTIQLNKSLPIGVLLLMLGVLAGGYSPEKMWDISTDNTMQKSDLKNILPPSSVVYFVYTHLGKHEEFVFTGK